MHGAVDVFHRHPQRLCLFPVYVDQQLPGKHVEGGGNGAEFRALFGFCDKGADHLSQLVDGGVALALHPYLHAACGAQAGNGRRIDRKNNPALYRGKSAGGFLNDRRGTLFLDCFRVLVALLEILEPDEEGAGIVLVLAVEQAVAVNDGDALDGFVVHEEVTGYFAHLAGAIQAGGIGHDYGPQQITLVFRWQEGTGNALRHQQNQNDHAGKE
ncbi:hypothetical protein D3C87_1583570 [compost metagenome]